MSTFDCVDPLPLAGTLDILILSFVTQRLSHFLEVHTAICKQWKLSFHSLIGNLFSGYQYAEWIAKRTEPAEYCNSHQSSF